MNRYIVVDLKDNVLYSVNDLKQVINDNNDIDDNYSSSITCVNNEDTINELETWVDELKETPYYKENKKF